MAVECRHLRWKKKLFYSPRHYRWVCASCRCDLGPVKSSKKKRSPASRRTRSFAQPPRKTPRVKRRYKTRGVPWILGHGRFLVIAVTKDRPSSAGTVFQAADGTFFVFSPARTRKQADRLAASIPGSTVVVVRRSFSFPAKDWVAADPRFWRANAR